MRNKQNNTLKWFATIGMAIICLIALFPIIMLLISSLRPSYELMLTCISLAFDWRMLYLSNYEYIFTQAVSYWTWYVNSLIISAITIVLSLFFSSMVGYALAVYDFKGRNLFFTFVVFILMVPFEILMLPLFQMMISASLV